MTPADELQHRLQLWSRLQGDGAAGLDPSLLRELGVYGGAQGIWVDKARTGALTPNGSGVTVGVLHTGQHYPDDLSDEGLIYHYPETGRSAKREDSEVAATKATKELRLPVFVVLRGDRSASKRRVRLGWVEDWDDSSKQFLILFGETEPPYYFADDDTPFDMVEHVERRLGRGKVRAGQQQFRFKVLKRYGCKCAVCSIAPGNVVSDKFHETTKFYSLTHHFRPPGVFAIGLKTWSRLTPQDQKVLAAQAAALQAYEFDLTKKVEQEALEELKAKGMQINQVDTAAFRKAVQPVYDKFTAKFGSKLVDAVEQTK